VRARRGEGVNVLRAAVDGEVWSTSAIGLIAAHGTSRRDTMDSRRASC